MPRAAEEIDIDQVFQPTIEIKKMPSEEIVLSTGSI